MLRGVVVDFFSVDDLLLCDGVSLKLSESPQHKDRLTDEICSLFPLGVGWNGEVSVI